MTVGKVLVVEDNALNMELAMALLEQAGCDALQAGDAELGIELAKTELPHLILMDVSLPGMDGVTAVRKLKSDPITRDIPVIVMTSHAMKGDKERVMEAGSDGYLSKPISVREFLQMVAGFIPN
jgi:two-component system, cell cycle response regulator DivK